MFRDSSSEELQQRDEDLLSKASDIAWIVWHNPTMKLGEEGMKAEGA